MTEAEVFQVVCEVLRAQTGHGWAFTPETHLVDQLGLDSLGLLSLTVELENRFELCLEPDEDEPLLRLGDVVGLLVRMQERAEQDAREPSREEATA